MREREVNGVMRVRGTKSWGGSTRNRDLPGWKKMAEEKARFKGEEGGGVKETKYIAEKRKTNGENGKSKAKEAKPV